MDTRKRLYVGITPTQKYFKFWATPRSVTRVNYPDYIYAVGPFRSVAGVNACISLKGNPSMQTVAEFEKYGKSRKNNNNV